MQDDKQVEVAADSLEANIGFHGLLRELQHAYLQRVAYYRSTEGISEIAEADCRHICRKVILAMQRLTEGMQSGDDSPLKNVWDEICVQVQFQESFYRSLYLDTIRVFLRPSVQKLDSPRKLATLVNETAKLFEVREVSADKADDCY